MDESEAIAWQDVFDEIAAGRSGDIACPFCGAKPLSVEVRGGLTRVSCPHCARFVEGRFQGS